MEEVCQQQLLGAPGGHEVAGAEAGHQHAALADGLVHPLVQPVPAPQLEYKSSPAPGAPPPPQSAATPHSPQLAMVSRRAIISRSRDDLQHHLGMSNKNFTGEDQWFSKEKLYKVKYA